MRVVKLLLICALCVCALLCCWPFPFAPNYALQLLDIFSGLWAVLLQAASPLLFLLLNLVMGALLFVNSGFLQSSDQTTEPGTVPQHDHQVLQEKKVLPQLNSPGASSIPSSSSSSARGLPSQNSIICRHLGRSKSEKHPASAPGLSKKSNINQRTDFQADQSAKKNKKKKKGASSHVADQGERAAAGENARLKKASSVPITTPSPSDGDGDNEVDRRADDFISKFYMQMKMQRLESLKRSSQHLDRSYGR